MAHKTFSHYIYILSKSKYENKNRGKATITNNFRIRHFASSDFNATKVVIRPLWGRNGTLSRGKRQI